ncbi:prolyl oligopeptidase family serine peptidase [Kitasatospora sp. NBC_01250]|uniref:prolyl oligopeptidase family serine peptidase n=1 Tax=unclassified Kitasatospora TaxID=2633591 RepID=UPI002E14D312|nr:MULTISPECIES: prolyl oligopeptidase family serine peptidase [unclassified Kitasatospora]WSJ70059.1 prolyl oligopeptidase family serine peptidase [Kitasatospora sp. NBC_01302]
MYPVAPRGETVERLGERAVADPYRLLEDAAHPDTRRWSAAQDDLFRRVARGWPGIGAFRSALERLTAFEQPGVPRFAGGRVFCTVRAPDGGQPVLVVEEAGGRRVLVDPGGRGVLGGWSPDPTGRLVAYQGARSQGAGAGSTRYTLRILEVATGRLVDAPIDGCRYGTVAWTADADAFYYSRGTEDGGELLHLHRLGRPVDQEVFGAGLPAGTRLDATTGAPGRTLVVTATGGRGAGHRLWVADLRQGPLERPQLREQLIEDWGAGLPWPAADGTLYLLDRDRAPHGRLLAAAPGAPVRTLLAGDEHTRLDSFAVLDGAGLPAPELLVLRSSGSRSLLTRHRLDSGAALGAVELPGPGVVAGLTRAADGRGAWFGYADPRTPQGVHRYDAAAGRRTLWRAGGRSGPGAPEVLVTELGYPAADGSPVRLLLTRPAAAPAGPLPTILQAHGAFGAAQLAGYHAAALAWAERGGQFAVAGVRGGGEEGADWRRAGMREQKQQGIDDFSAAAQYLLDTGRCAPGRLGALGRGAGGGLLVGAALTQRPELFGAVALSAALLDMARYQLSGHGPYWTEEFGSREEPRELDWLLGYSPYHHVRPGTAYPAVLLTAFEADERVDALHARKMCAALQQASSSGRPVLLRRAAGPGRGAGARGGRPARSAQLAELLAFFAEFLELPAAG